MSHPAEDLLRAVVLRMAEGQRVLLNGTSFETLALLADADVRELVVVSEDADPDAPAGETAHGAPLRLRPDWKERPRSKDIVLDPHGTAPADQVVRILKKHGVYLTTVESPVLDALATRQTVTPDRAGALVLDTTGEASGFVQVMMTEGERSPGTVEFFAAGHTEASLPVVGLVTATPTVDRSELDAALEGRAQAEARVAELQSTLETAREDASDERRRADAGEAAAEAARADGEALRAELATLTTDRDRLARREAALVAELATAEADYAAVRTELAERRVEDRRFESLRARFGQARDEMTAEVQSLRARLLNVDGLAADAESLLADRDRARADSLRLIARLSDTVARLAPDRRLPASPVPAEDEAAGAALDAWLQAVEGAFGAVAAELDALRDAEEGWIERGEALTTRVRELHAAIEALTAEQADAQVQIAPLAPASDEALNGRIAALEQALQAERALRAAEAAERARAIDAARAAAGIHDALRDRLTASRRAVTAAMLGKAAAEDELKRLRGELDQRAEQATVLEDTLAGHERMEGLLTGALHSARDRTEVAEAGRRQAEASLRVLRDEYERISG